MTNNAHSSLGEDLKETPPSNDVEPARLARPLYQKPASEFERSDIPLLGTLEEGWFVEFKDRSPDTAKFARSISSFANSHGGLLVIGAREEQKTRRLASFCPRSRESAEQCIQRARESVTAHVTPPPFFEAKAVKVDSLAEDSTLSWIVVVSVPKGALGPYLHSNGCIYVRVGDAAAPHALDDLALQERMWSESMTRKAKIASRIERISEQVRNGCPTVHVVMMAENSTSDPKDLTFDDFRTIALDPHLTNAAPIFDHVQSLDSSFVARRSEGNIRTSSVVWDYDRHKSLHFIEIPLATLIWPDDDFGDPNDQFELKKLSRKLAEANVPSGLMVLNLLPTFFFLSIIVRKVQRLHERQALVNELRWNVRVVDAKGTVPFLGTPGFFGEVDATSFPYVRRELGFVRSLDDPATWFKLSVARKISEPDSNPNVDLSNSLGVFSQVAQTLGIPPYVAFGVRNADASTADWQPIANLISKLHVSSFSFTSKTNSNA